MISYIEQTFLAKILTVNPSKRITTAQALSDPWMLMESSHDGGLNSNLNDLKLYHAKRKFKAAIHMVKDLSQLLCCNTSIVPNVG